MEDILPELSIITSARFLPSTVKGQLLPLLVLKLIFLVMSIPPFTDVKLFKSFWYKLKFFGCFFFNFLNP